MTLGGYAGRVGHIDLTKREVSYAPIPEAWARNYIGARGLGVRYVFEAGPTVDPLGPDNVLCFMNGPLTGTEATMSGRFAVVTKSPLTGTVTDSHQGGWSAARLRWAGFDGLVFKGKAQVIAEPDPVVPGGPHLVQSPFDIFGVEIDEGWQGLNDAGKSGRLGVEQVVPAGFKLAGREHRAAIEADLPGDTRPGPFGPLEVFLVGHQVGQEIGLQADVPGWHLLGASGHNRQDK